MFTHAQKACWFLIISLLLASCNVTLKTSDGGIYWKKQRVNVDNATSDQKSNQLSKTSPDKVPSESKALPSPGKVKTIDYSTLEARMDSLIAADNPDQKGKVKKVEGLNEAIVEKPSQLITKFNNSNDSSIDSMGMGSYGFAQSGSIMGILSGSFTALGLLFILLAIYVSYYTGDFLAARLMFYTGLAAIIIGLITRIFSM